MLKIAIRDSLGELRVQFVRKSTTLIPAAVSFMVVHFLAFIHTLIEPTDQIWSYIILVKSRGLPRSRPEGIFRLHSDEALCRY